LSCLVADPKTYAQPTLFRVSNLFIVLSGLLSWGEARLFAQPAVHCSDKWFKCLMYSLLDLTGIQLLFGIGFVWRFKLQSVLRRVWSILEEILKDWVIEFS
jgi:hypothetical protein